MRASRYHQMSPTKGRTAQLSSKPHIIHLRIIISTISLLPHVQGSGALPALALETTYGGVFGERLTMVVDGVAVFSHWGCVCPRLGWSSRKDTKVRFSSSPGYRHMFGGGQLLQHSLVVVRLLFKIVDGLVVRTLKEQLQPGQDARAGKWKRWGGKGSRTPRLRLMAWVTWAGEQTSSMEGRFEEAEGKILGCGWRYQLLPIQHYTWSLSTHSVNLLIHMVSFNSF